MKNEHARVLVIEDDAGIANMIKTIFRLNKTEAVFAANGRDGLELLANHDIGMIICDIMLPDIIGYDILARVKEAGETNHIPFVFLTAFATQPDIQKGLEAGADDYITKPFTVATLMNVVHKFSVV